jgi:sporulation protein YqfC
LRNRENPLGSLADLGIPFHLELNGNREAVVEGCCGVLEYGGGVVRVRTKRQVIRFTGRGLVIRCLTADALVVAGYITGIEFLG